jgi:hypothetical protein
MSEVLATWIVRVLGAYVGLGLGFSVPFTLVGAGRLDPVARHGTIGFRLLIIPGVAAFWPILAWRWYTGQSAPPEERNAHRDAAASARRSPQDQG